VSAKVGDLSANHTRLTGRCKVIGPPGRTSRGRAGGVIYCAHVRIDKDREPRLQIDDGEPIAIDSAEVQRDVERSTLTNVMCKGEPFSFVAGTRVTLWQGPPDKTSVVFVGKAIDERNVLDLISTETDEELDDYESI
jgi:hypothetical protein